MKSIVALSSLALVSLSSISPCLAASQTVSRSSDQALPSQALPSAAKPTLVAGFFDPVNLIKQGFGMVKQEQLRKEQQERKEQLEKDRQAREAARAQERQQQAEAYQKQQQESAAAATAAREQEQKRFDSMTPAQKKVYLAQKEAIRKQEVQEATVLIKILLGGMGSGGSEAPQQGGMTDQDKWNRDHQPQRPVVQDAPVQTPAISPWYEKTGGVGN